MKIILFGLFFFCIHIVSFGQRNDNIDNYKIKSYSDYKEIIIPFNHDIGYRYTDGEFFTVTGMTLVDESIYFGDPVLGRINKLNFKTGHIIYGKKGSIDTYDHVEDLIYFRNHIYCISWMKSIIIFNSDLEPIQLIKDSLYVEGSCFITKVNDTLEIKTFYGSDLYLFTVNRDGKLTKQIIPLNSSESLKEWLELKKTIKGKQFEEIEIDGIPYLKSGNNCYELKTKILKNKYYYCPNLDFNENTVAFFDVNEISLIFYIYEY